jgi:hypothetical protein
MPSLRRSALALAALALLALALAGCGSAEQEFSGSAPRASTASQLVDQVKDEARPAERSFMDEHRQALEDATGIEVPEERDESADEEVEYGEDGQPVGDEVGKEEQEYGEGGEPVEEARGS